MSRVVDLTGQTFGRLRVLGRAPNKGKDAYWKCSCECGNTKEVRGGRLTKGLTKSCGCTKVKDLTGQTFGFLTVLERGESHRNLATWKCRCKCGKLHVATGNDLRTGSVASCGCANNTIPKNAKHGGIKDVPREYAAWRTIEGNYVSEWEDFVQFFCDVGEKPGPDFRLCRRDATKPHGPKNTYWRNAKDERNLEATDLGEDFVLDLRSLALAEAATGKGEVPA